MYLRLIWGCSLAEEYFVCQWHACEGTLGIAMQEQTAKKRQPQLQQSMRVWHTGLKNSMSA
jgi:hypothetical protein